MIDVRFPDQNFSVAEYKQEAGRCLKSVLGRKKTAIVCGGTPLYLTALLFDFEIPPENKKEGLREELFEIAERDISLLIERLKTIDPEALSLIDQRNVRKIVRAIELYEQAGVRYSELYKRWKEKKPLKGTLLLWIYRERSEIYEAINQRVDKMIKLGFVEEVSWIRERFNLSQTARQAIGYQEIIAYLDGKISLEEAIDQIKKRTRNYAKRQISWFKNEKHFLPVDISGLSCKEAAEKIFNRYLI
jgi:tRNA dimethylallyltransferase